MNTSSLQSENNQLPGIGKLIQILGAVIIGFAVLVLLTDQRPLDLIDWAWQLFGPVFIAAYLVLCALALQAYHQIGVSSKNVRQLRVCHQRGIHAASGIATLALTFTLLGISLGIGSLAEQSLTPESIATVIAGLTRNFSQAFMTSVVGLPTAALLRGILAVRVASSPLSNQLIT